jgi:hypothetical protein
MTYTSGGTFQTALFRALIAGLVAAATAALSVYAVTDELKPVILAAVGAFVGCGAVRGLVEGSIDSGRQRAGEVVAADVQAGTAGDA